MSRSAWLGLVDDLASGSTEGPRGKDLAYRISVEILLGIVSELSFAEVESGLLLLVARRL